jgi:hypothetical protein
MDVMLNLLVGESQKADALLLDPGLSIEVVFLRIVAVMR